MHSPGRPYLPGFGQPFWALWPPRVDNTSTSLWVLERVPVQASVILETTSVRRECYIRNRADLSLSRMMCPWTSRAEAEQERCLVDRLADSPLLSPAFLPAARHLAPSRARFPCERGKRRDKRGKYPSGLPTGWGRTRLYLVPSSDRSRQEP